MQFWLVRKHFEVVNLHSIEETAALIILLPQMFEVRNQINSVSDKFSLCSQNFKRSLHSHNSHFLVNY